MLALDQAIALIQSAYDQKEQWEVDDDLCDCTFQRVGRWYNPYLGEMLEVRLCCIWAEIYKQYPQFVRTISTEPAGWNGEREMPKGIWHRQLSKVWNITVPEAREMEKPAPKGIPRQPRRSLLSRLFRRV